MGDWGDVDESDAFGSNHGFGGGDVFGQDFEDVDPFRANDSFGGDFEWDEFNGDGKDESDSGSEEVHSEDEEGARRRDRNDEKKRSSSSSSRHKVASTSSSRRDSDKKKSSSSSSRRSDASRRSTGSKSGNSGSMRKSRTTGGSTSGRDRENERDRDRDSQRSERRSVRKSSTSASKPRSSSRKTSREISPKGRRSVRDPSPRGGGSRHSHSPQKATRRAMSHGAVDGFDAAAFDAFGGNGDPFAAAAPANDGFGDFADFGGAGATSQQQGASADGFGDDFAGFAQQRTSSRPPKPSTISGYSSNRPDDHRGHSQHQRQQRRGSLDVGSSHGQQQEHSTHSASSTRFRLRSKTNGGMRPIRPSEKNSLVRASSERRSAINDSLFGALGEEDPNNGMSLESFLGESSKRGGQRTTGGGSVSGDASIQSAPALLRPPLRSRRAAAATGMDSVPTTPNSLAGKSRRYQRKMGLTPAARDTPTKHKEPMKLDIAALAEQGYLEVQDGKMRLVIDMDND